LACNRDPILGECRRRAGREIGFDRTCPQKIGRDPEERKRQ
jgi:hypothetical protein